MHIVTDKPARDPDTLREVSAVKLRKLINVKLDWWSKVLKSDPRNCISQEEILTLFATKHTLNALGVYYVTMDDIEVFCEEIWELMIEREVMPSVNCGNGA